MKKYLNTKVIFIGLILLGLLSCKEKDKAGKSEVSKSVEEKSAYYNLRQNMVESQIVARGIMDNKVINAMKKVPRHKFVPDELIGYAYRDFPLPIGQDQTISQPYIVALMTELLSLSGNEAVLEIGTGSGYQAAILGEIVNEVVSIEIIPELAEQARTLLDSLGYKNVTVITGDGYSGLPERAPFDCIIITAAPPSIPQPLIDQLKSGGRLVAPVGKVNQDLVLMRKSEDGSTTTESVIPVRFVPMTGKAMEK